MKSFFDSKDLKTDNLTDRGRPATCASCGLYKSCKSPKMEPYGENKKRIMIISDTPTSEDDKKGKPFQSTNGRMFQNILKDLGFSLFKDCVSLHSVNCYTEEIEPQNTVCCRPKISKAIKKYKPKVIILLGIEPVKSIIGNKWKKKVGAIGTWVGWNIPDRDYNSHICPVFHPDYLFDESNENKAKLIKKVWEKDLKNALNCINNRRPNSFLGNPESCIEYIENDYDFKNIIARIKKAKLISIDYETTGLKPHHPDHKIVCTGVAYTGVNSAAWMNTPERDEAFKKILRDRTIKKTAHNIPFEDVWSRIKIGFVRNWYWCSMNTAHILDNRKAINSLKFQVYINFGVSDYDSIINPYLKSKNKKLHGGNSFNTIFEFIEKYGERALLKYVGLDALYGYNLTTKQIGGINNAQDIPY